MQILNGKQISENLLNDLRIRLSEFKERPKLAIIQIGEEKPSKVYISIKEKIGKEIGIDINVYRFHNDDISSLGSKIEDLNTDTGVHGIILQLPTPGNEIRPLLDLISPLKDVDGLTSNNLGKIWHNESQQFLGATPKAIMFALEHISENSGQSLLQYVSGKNILIINHNILIGKPLAGKLTNLDATVTLAHSKTNDLEKHMEDSDVIVSATGKRIITFENSKHLKQDVVIIDSGYSIEDGVVSGDVDVNSVREKAAWLSPVPGGIGPLGVAMLMRNTFEAFLNSRDMNHSL